MLEPWGMLSTSSLPSLLGPLYMGQIELNCVITLN